MSSVATSHTDLFVSSTIVECTLTAIVGPSTWCLARHPVDRFYFFCFLFVSYPPSTFEAGVGCAVHSSVYLRTGASPFIYDQLADILAAYRPVFRFSKGEVCVRLKPVSMRIL